MDRRADLAISVGVLIFGVLLFIATRFIALGQIQDPVGTRGVPTFIAMLFIAGGAALTYRRAVTWRTDPILVAPDGKEDEPGHPASARTAFLAVGASAAYAASLPYAGFLLATPALLACLMWLLGARSWLMIAIVAVVYSVVVYGVFVLGLSVRLPAGILEGPLDALGLLP
jgi:putative tricarboxylic transport membrane protein